VLQLQGPAEVVVVDVVADAAGQGGVHAGRGGEHAGEGVDPALVGVPEGLVLGERVVDRYPDLSGEVRSGARPFADDLEEFLDRAGVRGDLGAADGVGGKVPSGPYMNMRRCSVLNCTGRPGGIECQAPTTWSGDSVFTPCSAIPSRGHAGWRAAMWTAIAEPIEWEITTTPGRPAPCSAHRPAMASSRTPALRANVRSSAGRGSLPP
jgi:hypothetical protein